MASANPSNSNPFAPFLSLLVLTRDAAVASFSMPLAQTSSLIFSVQALSSSRFKPPPLPLMVEAQDHGLNTMMPPTTENPDLPSSQFNLLMSIRSLSNSSSLSLSLIPWPIGTDWVVYCPDLKRERSIEDQGFLLGLLRICGLTM